MESESLTERGRKRTPRTPQSHPSTRCDPGPCRMKCWPTSTGFLGRMVLTACKAHGFQRVDATLIQRWAGDFQDTVIDFGFWVIIHPPAASLLTFGWSSDMAKLVAEHKTEMLNIDQGQIKVTMRQMTQNKPFHVGSFWPWEGFETSCPLFRGPWMVS